MYTLRLYHDRFAPGTAADIYAQHSIIYVCEGNAELNGEAFASDTASYKSDAVGVVAGAEGALIWRWELVPEHDGPNIAGGDGVTSKLRMVRKIKMFEMFPTTRWLFKLDCIIESEGSTGLHTHPGSGIRCLLGGKIRTVSEKGEDTVNEKRGDCWYEEGVYPLISLTEKATFLRGMILPPEYADVPGESPTWMEGQKPCESGWKGYVKQVVHLR
jgi:hypothetical protein